MQHLRGRIAKSDVRTTYVHTYASSTVSRHFGAETKRSLAVGGMKTSLFCAIIPTLFPYFLPFWYPYILLHFEMFFITCLCHLFSSSACNLPSQSRSQCPHKYYEPLLWYIIWTILTPVFTLPALAKESADPSQPFSGWQ